MQYLCCSSCRGDLLLNDPRWEQGEIWEGQLQCTQCSATYPVKDGIPRSIPKEIDETVELNVRNFGDQWHLMKDRSEINRAEFLSYLEDLSPDFFKDKVLLDGGCGIGKFLYYSGKWGAKDVIGIDLSHAVEEAFQWTREMPNVHVVQADIYNLPLRKSFDFIYSIGVLHHLPNPVGGFRKLVPLLRPGGRILAWVYGYEGNELYIKFADPLRRFTCRLPLAVNKIGAQALAGIFWGLIYAVYLPLDRIGFKRLPLNEYFLYFRKLGFRIFWGTVLDKMTPSISHYYRREEFEKWFTEMNLKNSSIRPRNGNSWRWEAATS